MKNYIIVEVCCLDCKRMENLIVLPFQSLNECKRYLKNLICESDNNNSFLIYNQRGEYLISLSWGELYDNEY